MLDATLLDGGLFANQVSPTLTGKDPAADEERLVGKLRRRSCARRCAISARATSPSRSHALTIWISATMETA
jgi:hypothetical protein